MAMRIGVIFRFYGGNIMVILPLQPPIGMKNSPHHKLMGALELLLGKLGIQMFYTVNILLFGRHLLRYGSMDLRHFRRT